MKSPGRAGGVLALVLLLSLLAVACGDGNGQGAGGGDTSPGQGQAAATQEASEPVELGDAQVSIGARVLSFAPYLVALEQGWYEDSGLGVELFDTGGGAIAVQALLSGDVVLGGSGAPEAINAALTGGQSRIVGTVAVNLGSEVVISETMAEEKGISRDASLADRVEALRGLRIGITSSGSTTDQLIRFLFTSNGLDPNQDAQILALGGTAEIVSALRGGSVDAVVLSPPAGQILEGEDVGRVLISPPRGDVPSLEGMIFITFSARVEDMQDPQRRAQMVELLAGVARYQRLVHDDPDEAKRLAREAFQDLDQEVFDAAFEVVAAGFPENPVPTEQSIQTALEFQEQTLGEAVEWSFEDVADPSVAEEAVAALEQ